MACSGIYEIICAVNGKRYIGSTADFAKRWSQHRYDLGRGLHGNRHLQSAWDKHGGSSFVFNVIEVIGESDRLIGREQHHLDRLKPEYNIARVAGSRRGVKHSDEVLARMSAAQKSVWNNDERRAKASERLHKRWASADRRRASAAALKSKWDDPEFRARMTAAQKAAWNDPGFRARREAGMRGAASPRAIKQRYSIQKDGVTITGIPFHLKEKTGLSSSSLSALIKGRQHSAKGWRLVAD